MDNGEKTDKIMVPRVARLTAGVFPSFQLDPEYEW